MQGSYLRHVYYPRVRGVVRDPESFDLRPSKGAPKGAPDKTAASPRDNSRSLSFPPPFLLNGENGVTSPPLFSELSRGILIDRSLMRSAAGSTDTPLELAICRGRQVRIIV